MNVISGLESILGIIMNSLADLTCMPCPIEDMPGYCGCHTITPQGQAAMHYYAEYRVSSRQRKWL